MALASTAGGVQVHHSTTSASLPKMIALELSAARWIRVGDGAEAQAGVVQGCCTQRCKSATHGLASTLRDKYYEKEQYRAYSQPLCFRVCIQINWVLGSDLSLCKLTNGRVMVLGLSELAFSNVLNIDSTVKTIPLGPLSCCSGHPEPISKDLERCCFKIILMALNIMI
jgi:hypothetical protein